MDGDEHTMTASVPELQWDDESKGYANDDLQSLHGHTISLFEPIFFVLTKLIAAVTFGS